MRILKLTLIFLWVLLWFFPVAVAHFLKRKSWRATMVQAASSGILYLCGVHVKTYGAASDKRPLMAVSNHLSYMDIPVLASVMDCRFAPKKEVAGWPFIGWICRIVDVVFIDRSIRKIEEGRKAIRDKLAQGEIVSLFPEATTGEGRHLLPFKAAFFEVDEEVMIQPVAIAYRKIRGLPIDYGQWPMIAWYGDMLLLPHIWKLLSIGRIDVEVHFLPLLDRSDCDRKILASRAHDAIEDILQSGEIISNQI